MKFTEARQRRLIAAKEALAAYNEGLIAWAEIRNELRGMEGLDCTTLADHERVIRPALTCSWCTRALAAAAAECPGCGAPAINS